ncbi:MAG: hypothetical protein V9H26_19110 [Verrucomicrobiota bacterium]
MPADVKRQFVGQVGCAAFSKTKTARGKTFGRGDELGAAYFLALQVGQVAQEALLSVQHFMPQAAVAFPVAQHFLEAQPATRAAAQMVRARSLMVFMVCYWFIIVFFDRLPPG